MNKWEEVYRRQAGRVYRTAMVYLRESHDAEDIVQSVFLTCIEKGIEFKNERHENAWFSVAARNRCLDVLKSGWRQRVSLAEADDWRLTSAADPEGESQADFAGGGAGSGVGGADDANAADQTLGAAAADITAEELLEMLMSLPQEQREALYYRCYEGYKIREIAEMTDTPETTVQARVAAGKKKICKMISDRMGD